MTAITEARPLSFERTVDPHLVWSVAPESTYVTDWHFDADIVTPTLSAGTLNINSATALGTSAFTYTAGTIDNTGVIALAAAASCIHHVFGVS